MNLFCWCFCSGDIVAWARKKMGPPVEIIKSVSDAEKLLHVDTPLAIAYVEFLEVMHKPWDGQLLLLISQMTWIGYISEYFFFQHFKNTDYEAFAPWVLMSVYGFGCTQCCKLLEQLDNQVLWFCLSFMSVFFSKGTSYMKFIPGCFFLIVEEVWQGRHAEEFTAVASEEDGVLFYMTNDDTIALVFGLEKKTPSVVLLKQEDEKASTFGKGFHMLLASWMN